MSKYFQLSIFFFVVIKVVQNYFVILCTNSFYVVHSTPRGQKYNPNFRNRIGVWICTESERNPRCINTGSYESSVFWQVSMATYHLFKFVT